MSYTRWLSARFLFLMLGLLLGSLILIGTGAPAYAGRSICRADPIIHLTDGTAITMMTDLDVAVDEITKIKYYVHVPWNASLDYIEYDVGAVGVREQVFFYADQASDQYELAQFAVTHGRASVIATNTIGATTGQASGESQTLLTVRFANP